MTFEHWLQERLNAHGFSVAVDGDIGAGTRAAIRKFQRLNMLNVNGLADKATVGKLRQSPEGGMQQHVEPKQSMPVWLAEMTRRMGLHERRDRLTLMQWLRAGLFLGDPSKLPWCGDAVETCIVKTLDEPVPGNPFWAQAWKDFAIDAGGPICGAIGVIRWSSLAGHVGFVIGYDPVRQRVKLRGGNQSDSIRDDWFPLSKFIAFRWPKSVPVSHYPYLAGPAGSVSGVGATR
jgi:uncharacterized protein (TIGR02594 family)